LVTDPDTRIDIPEIKKHPFFLKGKEIFEQEFSICQIDKEDNNNNDLAYYENLDLNNILESSILKSDAEKETLNENSTNKKQKKAKNEKKHKKDKKDKNKNKDTIEKKTRNKETNKSINLIDQPNILQRLNTEFDDKRSNMRNVMLDGLNKVQNDEMKYRNNSAVKKNVNKNSHNIRFKHNKGTSNKKNVPFKRRNVILMKNDKNILSNNKKDNKKLKSRDIKSYKKLTKTNNYSNIRRNNKDRNKFGKSVNLRNRNHRNYNKILHHTRNNYTNIIQNKYNSKEELNIKKVNKKDNRYFSNLNNTFDEDNMSNKKKLNYDFNNGSKKMRSKGKKNSKLNSIEATFHQKNTKFIDNLFNINSSSKKYENTLNPGIIHNTKKNYKEKSLKYYLFGKDNNNQDRENNSKNKKNRENKIKVNNNNEKEKKTISKYENITNPNISIIDNTQDEDNDSIEINNTDNDKKKVNDNSNYKKVNKNKKSSKKIVQYSKTNKDKNDKNTKKNVNKANKPHTLKQQYSNLHSNKKRNIKLNYYINEIEQKTIDNEHNKVHKHGINTDILDYPEIKKNNYYSLKKRMNKKKSINNKTTISDKENLVFHNHKKDFSIIDNSIIKNNNALNTIDNISITEPKMRFNSKKLTKTINKKSNKNSVYINNEKHDKKIYYKKINTQFTHNNDNHNKDNIAKKNNIHKRQYNIIDNNSKQLNKTSNNYNKINPPMKNQLNSNHQNLFELISNSSIHNSHKNPSKKIRKRKSGQMISNNNKKPIVTIKNTVINVNIDTGIILSSVDKKRKKRKLNSKRGNNNSISHINKQNLMALDTKYNDYLTSATIAKISHSNTNENFPIKTKSINVNDNLNLLSLNEEADSNNNFSINKNSNFQKIYIYGEKTASKRKHRAINIKESKNDNDKKIHNNNSSNHGKKHMKYKSMKIDEFYEIKDKKKDPKNIFFNTNEASFHFNK
jgi:hypothetical protein